MRDLVSIISDVTEALKPPITYDRLIHLDRELQDANATEGAQDIGSVRAALYVALGDWHTAHRIAAGYSDLFPTAFDHAMTATLTAINLGDYRSAIAFLPRCLTKVETLFPAQMASLIDVLGTTGMFEEADALLSSHTPAVNQNVQAQRVRTAIQNTRTVVGRVGGEVSLISVGANCAPWLMLNRWGLRPKVSDIANDLPFNLAQTTPAGSGKVLRDRLAHLVDPTQLVQIENANGVPIVYNKKYGLIFNHEYGTYWAERDFAPLRSLYEARIERFFEALAPGRSNLFVLFSDTGGNFAEVFDALNLLDVSAHFKMIVVDMTRNSSAVDQPSSNGFAYYAAKLPSVDYVWHLPECYNSPEGYAFEYAIQEAVIKCMMEV